MEVDKETRDEVMKKLTKILSKKLNVIHLSTGEILRSEILKNTKVGKIAKSYIDQGNLVPDDFILDIISKQISTNIPNEGYLFDGFPRTIPQAVGFDTLLTEIGHSLNAAINLIANENELIERTINTAEKINPNLK